MLLGNIPFVKGRFGFGCIAPVGQENGISPIPLLLLTWPFHMGANLFQKTPEFQ